MATAKARVRAKSSAMSAVKGGEGEGNRARPLRGWAARPTGWDRSGESQVVLLAILGLRLKDNPFEDSRGWSFSELRSVLPAPLSMAKVLRSVQQGQGASPQAAQGQGQPQGQAPSWLWSNGKLEGALARATLAGRLQLVMERAGRGKLLRHWRLTKHGASTLYVWLLIQKRRLPVPLEWLGLALSDWNRVEIEKRLNRALGREYMEAPVTAPAPGRRHQVGEKGSHGGVYQQVSGVGLREVKGELFWENRWRLLPGHVAPALPESRAG